MPEAIITSTPGGAQVADLRTLGKSGGMSGQSAMALLEHGPTALRTFGTLRKDEWIEIDRVVTRVARDRLRGVADLRAAGLTKTIPNALGTTRIEWEKVSEMDPAEMSMSGLSQSQNDRVVFDLDHLPVPIIYKDFQINLRALMASRKQGTGLDTLQIEMASRKVSEYLEDLLWNGSTVLGSANPIYGYRTTPNRNTGSTTADWNSASGDQIVGDVLAMIEKATADNFFGPYVLYFSTAAGIMMSDDYKAESDKSILTRLREIPEISAFRSTNKLANNEALLVQMSPDVVELLDGMAPTTLQWESHAGFLAHFKIMTIMVPRFKNDILNQSGIVHYT